MLNCSIAESKPNATVDYTTTASSSSAGVEFTNNIISIASPAVGNTGNYTCTATTTANQASLMFTLCVGSKGTCGV